jgi:hypothetical protein
MLDLPTQQLEGLQMDSELLLEIACCGLEVPAASDFGRRMVASVQPAGPGYFIFRVF